MDNPGIATNPMELRLFLLLGIVMVVTGVVGVGVFFRRFRRVRGDLREKSTRPSNEGANLLGEFLMFSGFASIGLLLLILAGGAVIYYGVR